MYIKRYLETPFLNANRFFPALLVTGARQVGKTTFLRVISELFKGFRHEDFPMRMNIWDREGCFPLDGTSLFTEGAAYSSEM